MYGRFIPENKLEPRRRNEILGRHFVPKLSFCREELQRLDNDDFDAIRVAHEFRNELYHVGRRHDDIVYAVAWHYHDLACRLLGALPLETYYWQTDDTLSDVVIRHATREPWTLEKPFEVAGVSIAAMKPADRPELARVLAESLLVRLEVVENHFGWIVRGDEAAAFADAEFDEFAYGDSSPVLDRLRNATVEEREQILRELRANWQPTYTRNPLPAWRRRCETLSRLMTVGAALSRFAQLETEIEPFERAVISAANATIDAIEMEIEIMRGK